MSINTKHIDLGLIERIMPNRTDLGHKNDFGHVLIIAGSSNMTGAASMATGAALRSGAGLVKVFAPNSVLDVIRIQHPCAMTFPMEVDLKNNASVAKLMRDLQDLALWADSVLIGPGIDASDKIWDIILPFFISGSPNLILDASAFDVVTHDIRLYSKLLSSRELASLNPVIMTPHQGEFKRIYNAMVDKRIIEDMDEYDPLEALSILTEELEAIIVLKDYKTVISVFDGECYSIDKANSGLSKGGSGDVLSGLMAGMNPQFEYKTDSVIASVFFHSQAAYIAAKKLGKRFMLPTDVIDFLSEAYKKVGW